MAAAPPGGPAVPEGERPAPARQQPALTTSQRLALTWHKLRAQAPKLGRGEPAEVAAVFGFAAAAARLHWFHPTLLQRTPGWSGVSVPAVWAPLETYLATLLVLGLCGGAAALAAAVTRFITLHTRSTSRTRCLRSRLTPYPFDPHAQAVVIGELHEQEGAQVENPRWLVLPFEGLYGNVIGIGATGSAKTSSLAYPLTAQLLRIHSGDPLRKLGGLVMDPKGNYAHYVRRQCAIIGRGDDFYEITLGGDVVCNVLARPDLSAPALAGHFFDAVKNVQGESVQDPFWRQEAIDLCTQAIRVIRIVQKREPTLQTVYRVATSFESFEPWVKEAESLAQAARARIRAKNAAPEDHLLVEEVESLTFWAEGKLSKLDPKLRASIAAGLNGACSLFDVPEVRRSFAPTEEDLVGKRPFIGFREAIQRGLVVSLRIPGTQFKTVSIVVRTLLKLNFFDAVLEQLTHLKPGERPRPCFWVADEYDQVVTEPADGDYFARSREACAINVVATQSYARLVAKFKSEHAARSLMANLRTQVFLGLNDSDSAQEASRLCGEVDRERSTWSRGESLDNASWSWTDGRILGQSGGANEGLSRTVHREPLFPPGVFTALRKDQAVVRAFDGARPLPPWVVYLKPYYQDPDVSWYDGKDPHAGDVRLGVVGENDRSAR